MGLKIPPDVAILPTSLDSLDPGGWTPNSEIQPTQSQSSADTKYPTIQFNSDTNYPELAQAHRLRVQSHKTAPPHFRHPSQIVGSQFTHTFVLLGYKLGVPTSPPQVCNLLEQLTELRKTLYLCLPVYYKEYNSGTAK